MVDQKNKTFRYTFAPLFKDGFGYTFSNKLVKCMVDQKNKTFRYTFAPLF